MPAPVAWSWLAKVGWGIVVSVAMSVAQSVLFRPKQPNNSPTYGVGAMQTQTNSSMVMPIIYGRVKCAGNNLWQSGTGETVQRLVGFGVGQNNSVSGVCFNNRLAQAGPVFKLRNLLYADATIAVVDGGPTGGDKILRLYANGSTIEIILQDEIDVDNGSPDYQGSIGKLIQYLKGIGYTNGIKAAGWVVSDDVSTDDYPQDITSFSVTAAYSSAVTLSMSKGLPGCSYTAYMGDGEQAIDSRVTGDTQRDKALQVGGMKYDAYLALTIKGSDKLNGSPNVTAIWEGRIVRIYSKINTYSEAYTDNPAWCILDFCMSPDGCGIPEAEMDIQSFIDAAAYAQPIDGSRRWSLNLILDNRKKRQDWLIDMLLCCRAYPTYHRGMHGILVDKAETVSQVFTVQSDEEIELYWQDLSEDVERLFLKYIDPDYEWQSVTAPASMGAFRRPGSPLDKTIEINGVTNFNQASELAWFYLNQAQTCPGWIRYKTNRKALNRTIGDVVGVFDPITQLKEPGLDYKRYRIMSMTEQQGAGIEMVMREYNPNVYGDTRGSVAPVVSVTSLKNPTIKTGTVLNFSAAQSGRFAVLSWDALEGATCYDVRQGTVWETGKVIATAFTENGLSIADLAPGDYVFQIRPTGLWSRFGPVSTATVTMTAYVPNASNITIDEDTFLLKDGTALSDLAVAWTAADYDYIAGYNLYYELNNSGIWTLAAVVNGTGYTIKALQNTTSIKVKVVTVDRAGLASSGLVSDPYTITGKSAPPSDVTGLQYAQSQVDKTQIHLTWNQITDADFKAVELRMGGSAWGVDDAVLATVYGFAHDSTIDTNGTYVIRARSLDWSGNYSIGVAVITLPLTVTPSNVANFTMNQRENDRTKGIFTWMAVSDMDLSHYEIRQGANWETAPLVATQLKATSYEHTLLSESAQTYLVKAVSVAGKGSMEATSITLAPALRPSTPSALALVQSATNKTQLVASWQPVATSDFTAYEVCVGSIWSDVNKVVTKETAYSFSIASPGNHTVMVRSKSIAGWTSNPASATLNNVGVNPSNVGGFSSEQNPLDRRMIRFNWNAITDPDLSHYEIRKGSNWDSATVVKSNIKVNYHDEMLTAPVAGQKYLIKAINTSGFGSSVVGETLCTYILSATKPVSGSATVDLFDKTYIVVLWDRVTDTDLTGYEVRDGSENLIAFMKETTLRHKITNSGAYTFKVYATNVGANRSAALTINASAVMEPEDVTGFAATQDTNQKSRVRLSWTPVGDKDLSHYVIKEGASWAAGSVIGLKVFGNFFDTTITEERTYQYWIKASTIAGKESVVASSVTNLFSLEPTTPTGLSITADPADKTSLSIGWNSIADADLVEYEVRVGSVWDTGTIIAKTKETKIIWKPEETEQVNIMLVAKNAANFLSDVASTQFDVVLEPQNVVNFNAVQNGETVLLSWDRVTEADVVGYEIREGSSFGGGSALIVTGISETTYSVPVSTESLKKYHIKAINRTGRYSDQASTATVTVSNLLPKNVIQTYDEITLQSGTHSDTEFGMSAINFSNLPGRFSDYSTTRFNEIGGANVLKLKKRPAMAFSRDSLAYRNDGVQVAVHEPRFERALDGTPLGAKVEKGAKNILPVGADTFAGLGGYLCTYSVSATPDADGFYTITLVSTGAGYVRWSAPLSASGVAYTHSVVAYKVSSPGAVMTIDIGARIGLTTIATRLSSVVAAGHAYPAYYFGFYTTVAGTHIIKAKMPQVEEGVYLTSYVTPQVTRATEMISFPTTGIDKNNLDIQVYAGPSSLHANGYDMIFGLWTCFYLSRVNLTTLMLSWLDGTQKSSGASGISDLSSAGHTFRLTYDGTTAKVYVDGVLKISVVANFPVTLPANGALGQINSSDRAYPGNCNFRDLLICNSIRTTEEALLPPGWTSKTLLYYPLTDDLEAGYYFSGNYLVAPKDMGQVITANLSMDFISTALLTGGVNARLQYRTSTDGLNFTAWADFKPVLATFRYLEVRAELTTPDVNKTPEVNTFDISVDVPDTQKAGTATISAIGGTTIQYGHTYFNSPHVVATAIGAGLRAEIISVGVSSCVVKVYNTAGVEQSGASIKVSWSSLGY